MSAPRLASFSSGAVASSSNAARRSRSWNHACQLVHNASVGLPTTSRAAAIWAREFSGAARASQPFILRRQTSHAARLPTENIRTYGAAALAVEEEPTEIYPPRGPRSPMKRTTLANSWRDIQTRPRLHVDVQAALQSSETTPSIFRDVFEASRSQPGDLAQIPTLAAVWALWIDGAEASTWAWLAGQLGHMLHGEEDEQIRTVGLAMRARALVQLGQREEAIDALAAGANGASRNPLALGIRSLTQARLGDWIGAKRSLELFIRRICSSDYPLVDAVTVTLASIISTFQSEARPSDIVDAIRGAGKIARHRLLTFSDTAQRLSIQDESTARLLDVLADISEPGVWMDKALRNEPNMSTRWMGALFTVAMLRNRVPVIESREWLEYLDKEQLPLPLALRIRSLCATTDGPDATEVATLQSLLQSNDVDGISHSNFSQILRVAATHSLPELGNIAWERLCERFPPTDRDRHCVLSLRLATEPVPTFVAKVQQLYGDLEHPDALDLMLSKYARVNDVNNAARVFDILVEKRPSREIYTRLLSLYAVHALADEAIMLFDSMLDRGISADIKSVTALISLFANRRDVENARNVFATLPELGLEADAIAWTAILNAEVESGEWSAAAQHWTTMPVAMRYTPDVISVILKAYVMLATPTDRVLELFRRMARPTAYMWSLVIQSAIDDDKLPLAEKLFEEMRQNAERDAKASVPNVYHYSVLMYGYMQDNQQARAKETYEEMVSIGVVPTSLTYGMMLSSWRSADGATAYASAAQFASRVQIQARDHPEAPRSRGEAMENIFGPLITMAGRMGNLEEAEDYVDSATVNRPTVQSYTRLMDAYRRAGRVESVLAIWEQVFALASSISKETPSQSLEGVSTRRSADNILCIPLSIVLDSLASAGRYSDVREAWDRVQNSGFGFDAQNYNHYAVALAKTGDVERGFEVLEHIIIPRWNEVVARQVQAVRGARYGFEPISADALSDILGLPTQPAARPPNRRNEYRWSGTTSDRTAKEVDVQLLRGWRPTDLLWRPSLMTVSVLEHVYSQLQDAKSRAFFMLADGGDTGEVDDGEGEEAAVDAWGGEGDGDSKGSRQGKFSLEAEIAAERMEQRGPVTLPSFGDVAVRDPDGKVKQTTPRALIMRLNRKYSKAVAMIMFHRRKRQGGGGRSQ